MHFLLSVATLMNANNGWPGRSPVAAESEAYGLCPPGSKCLGMDGHLPGSSREAKPPNRQVTFSRAICGRRSATGT